MQQKLENEIPVITVVSVMGTTEESAMDPLTAILELREKFRAKVHLIEQNEPSLQQIPLTQAPTKNGLS